MRFGSLCDGLVSECPDLVLYGAPLRPVFIDLQPQRSGLVADTDVAYPRQALHRRFDLQGAGRAVHALDLQLELAQTGHRVTSTLST